MPFAPLRGVTGPVLLEMGGWVRRPSLLVLRRGLGTKGDGLDRYGAVRLRRRAGPVVALVRCLGCTAGGRLKRPPHRHRLRLASSASKQAQIRARVSHEEAQLHADQGGADRYRQSDASERMVGRNDVGDTAHPERARQPEQRPQAIHDPYPRHSPKCPSHRQPEGNGGQSPELPTVRVLSTNAVPFPTLRT